MYQLKPGLFFENIFPRNEIFFLFHLSRMNGIWRSLLIRLLSLRALVHTYFNSRGTGRIDKVEKMRYQQLFQKPDKQDRFTTCLKTCGTGPLTEEVGGGCKLCSHIGKICALIKLHFGENLKYTNKQISCITRKI